MSLKCVLLQRSIMMIRSRWAENDPNQQFTGWSCECPVYELQRTQVLRMAVNSCTVNVQGGPRSHTAIPAFRKPSRQCSASSVRAQQPICALMNAARSKPAGRVRSISAMQA